MGQSTQESEFIISIDGTHWNTCCLLCLHEIAKIVRWKGKELLDLLWIESLLTSIQTTAGWYKNNLHVREINKIQRMTSNKTRWKVFLHGSHSVSADKFISFPFIWCLLLLLKCFDNDLCKSIGRLCVNAANHSLRWMFRTSCLI